jgi:hypothetical protein
MRALTFFVTMRKRRIPAPKTRCQSVGFVLEKAAGAVTFFSKWIQENVGESMSLNAVPVVAAPR